MLWIYIKGTVVWDGFSLFQLISDSVDPDLWHIGTDPDPGVLRSLIRLFVLRKEVTVLIILLFDESGTPCIGPSNRISRQELDQQRCCMSHVYNDVQLYMYLLSSKQIFWTQQIANLQILGIISRCKSANVLGVPAQKSLIC
jgi:hypothetical protein